MYGEFSRTGETGVQKNKDFDAMSNAGRTAWTESTIFYHDRGYFPALRPGEKETEERVHPFEKRQAVAVTLGASYDDWALSLELVMGPKPDKTWGMLLK